MDGIFLITLLMQADDGTKGGTSEALCLLSFIIMIGVFWFWVLVIRPRTKRKKSSQAHLREQKLGTETKSKSSKQSALDSFTKALYENGKIYEIHIPKEEKWDAEKAKHLVKALIDALQGRLILRIVAEPGKVAWQVVDFRTPFTIPDHVVRTVNTLYPKAEVTIKDYFFPERDYPLLRLNLPFRLANDFVAPIRTVYELQTDDPLITITQAMSQLQERESITYTIYVDDNISSAELKNAKTRLQRPAGRDFLIGAATSMLTGGGSTYSPPQSGREGKGAYEEELQQVLEHKVYDQELYNVYINLQMTLTQENRGALTRLSSVGGALETRYFNYYNSLTASIDHFKKIRGEPDISPYSIENFQDDWDTDAIGNYSQSISGFENFVPIFKIVLGLEELAALWHLPNETFTAPDITWLSGARPSNEIIANTHGVAIGDSIALGQSQPIYIHPTDRETHLNIVGRTGVGKSTFMHNLIHQDIANGMGVGVVDPHGSLIRNILRVSIPENRIDDVILLDIANEDYPPPLNPIHSSIDANDTASEIVNILDKSERLGVPDRVADTLTAALATLRHEPGSTVRDVVKMFENAEYRHDLLHRVLRQVVDVTTHEFWEKFENQSPGMQENLTYPVITRIRKFYRNPLLHLMMCHPDRLDFAELIRQKKIVLVSLGIDSRRVPDIERELIGMVVMSQLQMSAMSSLNNTTPFYLYVDEVQNFVTTPLNKVFEEARKYQLHLTVANQYLGQLTGKTLESVMGTVGATVAFQIGERDAYILSPYYRPEFTTEDLVNQDLYHAAVKTRFKGRTMPAFNIATRRPPGNVEANEAIERERLIRQRSIELYTPKTQQEILEWLNNRYPPPTFPNAPNDAPNSPSGRDWVDSSQN